MDKKTLALALGFGVWGVSQATVTSAQQGGQAPELAQLVEAGELPPLEERLPLDPEVVSIGDIGSYGGSLRFGVIATKGFLELHGMNGLVRWDIDQRTIVPNLAVEFDASDDNREFTFRLRDGLKWSDGHPFTSADVAFNVNDIILNSEFSEVEQMFAPGGSPLRIEVIDDLNFKISFDNPHGDFLGIIATREGQMINRSPKHYCSQFLPAYNDNIDELVKAENTGDWQTLLANMCTEDTSYRTNTARPVINPWVVTVPETGSAMQVVWERNPYFWQVDEQGNQLPYIDRLEAQVFLEAEAMLLAAIGGQLDFQKETISNTINRPVLAENRDRGGYDLYEIGAPGGNYVWIMPNLNHQDPVIHDLINQKDFRVALSIGFDRNEVIQTALLGVGEPWQTGPYDENSPYYHEEISKQYVEYDPDHANELLDGLGLTERGPNGTRLMPDGRPARFKVDIRSDFPYIIDVMSVIDEHWNRIGIDLDLNVMDSSLYKLRADAAEHDFVIHTDEASWLPGEVPSALLPIDASSRHATQWRNWLLSDGAEGIEPPQHAKDRFHIWTEKVPTASSPEERASIMHELADMAADQFESFGVSKYPSLYGVKKRGLMNVLPGMLITDVTSSPNNVFLPQAWYWGK